MIARLLLVGAVTTAGCSTACPTGAKRDQARVVRLRHVIAELRDAQAIARQRALVCFTPGLGRGVLAGSFVQLDRDASDAELAGQLAHLLVHARDGLDDGCAKDLAAAEASEAHAAKLESELRERAGLPVPLADRSALEDYRRRCLPAR